MKHRYLWALMIGMSALGFLLTVVMIEVANKPYAERFITWSIGALAIGVIGLAIFFKEAGVQEERFRDDNEVWVKERLAYLDAKDKAAKQKKNPRLEMIRRNNVVFANFKGKR